MKNEKVQPVISSVLIFLFRCLIEVVGVYIIELTSLSHFIFTCHSLSLALSLCLSVGFSHSRLKH